MVDCDDDHVRPVGQRRWNIERISLIVAILAGIGSTLASAYAAFYAAQQAMLSRQALIANERNTAFATHIGTISTYCDALDLSAGRAQITSTFFRKSSRYEVVMSYKDGGTSRPDPLVVTKAHAEFLDVERSAIPLRIWLESPEVEFIERSVFGLRQDFLANILPTKGKVITDRAFVEVIARCVGLREVLIGWYKEPLSWKILNASDGVTVKLSPLPPY